MELMKRYQVTRGRAFVAECKRFTFQVFNTFDAAFGMRNHDRKVFGLTFIKNSADGLRTGLMIGQHIAPWPHQRDIGFAIGKRLGEAFPGIHGTQNDFAAQLGGEVIGEWTIGRVILLFIGLE